MAYTVVAPVLAVLVCEWLRPLLAPLFEAPFLFAVIVVVWLCGPGYAIVATLMSAGLLNYFSLEPPGTLGIEGAVEATRFVVFLASSAALIALVVFLHRAKSELESSEKIYRAVSEVLPFGNWSTGPDGSMHRVSESFW